MMTVGRDHAQTVATSRRRCIVHDRRRDARCGSSSLNPARARFCFACPDHVGIRLLDRDQRDSRVDRSCRQSTRRPHARARAARRRSPAEAPHPSKRKNRRHRPRRDLRTVPTSRPDDGLPGLSSTPPVSETLRRSMASALTSRIVTPWERAACGVHQGHAARGPAGRRS